MVGLRLPRAFLGWSLAAALVALGCAAALLFLPPPGRVRFADLAAAPLATGAAAACFRATRPRRTDRLAWGLLAAACLSWAVGEICWAVGSLRAPTSNGADGPGVDDVFYLLGVPLGIAALGCFVGPRSRGTSRVRSVLDGLIVGAVAVFISRSLGLLEPGEGSRAAQLITLAYPVGDLVMLTMAVTLLSRARVVALHLVLITAATACYVVGDTGYALAELAGTYRPGTLLDLTWPVSYLLFAVAALAPAAPQSTEDEPVDYRLRWRPWAILCLAMGAAAVVATATPRPLLGDAVTIGAGFFALLVFAVRQAGLVLDFSRVNRAMTGQVQRTTQISQAVLDGVLVADSRGRIRFVNGPAAALLGRAAPELTGRQLFDLLPAEPADQPPNPVLAALRDGTALTEATTTFRRADGSELPVELTIGPIRQRGRTSGVVVVFRDITARQALDRVKREFLSVVSHELRTPLASIRGALALVDGGVGGSLDATGARMVNIALLSSERLSRLLDDLLDMERLASGRVHFVPSAQSVRRLVELAVNEMSGLAVHQRVEIVAEPVDGLVWADPDRVVQMLANLLQNAIKFSTAGQRVTVAAAVTGAFVELSVVDRGRGIPANELERIFDPFVQVDSSDARPISGTGLGLAICRDLVRLHGGRIWVASTPGVGSEFRFTLPVAVATPDPGEPPADVEPTTVTSAR